MNNTNKNSKEESINTENGMTYCRQIMETFEKIPIEQQKYFAMLLIVKIAMQVTKYDAINATGIIESAKIDLHLNGPKTVIEIVRSNNNNYEGLTN